MRLHFLDKGPDLLIALLQVAVPLLVAMSRFFFALLLETLGLFFALRLKTPGLFFALLLEALGLFMLAANQLAQALSVTTEPETYCRRRFRTRGARNASEARLLSSQSQP
jgi:hypothetical protein